MSPALRRRLPAAGLLLVAALLGACEAAAPAADISRARLRLAAVAEASGQQDIALSATAMAAAAEPENAAVQSRHVQTLIRSGMIAEAQAALNRALARHPGNPALLADRARLLLLTGRPADALPVYEAVLAAAPANVGALSGRGVALDLLGRHPEAQASHREALRRAPDNLAAANNLATSLLLAGRPREAVEVLEPRVQGMDVPPRVANTLAIARAAAGLGTAGGEGLREETLQPLLNALSGLLGSGVPPAPPPAGVQSSLPAAAPAGRDAPRVQLVAAGSVAGAERHWTGFTTVAPDLAAGRSPVIRPVARPGSGRVWRLSVDGFAGTGEARRYCHTLRERGIDCWVRG